MSKFVSPRLGVRALGLAALLTLACAAHSANILIVDDSSSQNYNNNVTNLQAVCFPGLAATPPTDTVTVPW